MIILTKTCGNMKTVKISNPKFFVGAVFFLLLTACDNGTKQSQEPAKESQAAEVQKDGGMAESISEEDEEICPIDPKSPYWYDPNQEEVTFSEDGDTLFRFPRIRKGGVYVVPQSVKCIFERAFQGCRNLTALAIPNTVKYIGMAPFENCGNLEILDIRCQLDTLPFRFVGGCSKLGMIFLADKVPPFIEECSDAEEEQAVFELNFYGVSKEKCYIFVPHGSASLYRKAPVWRMFHHFLD